MSRRYSSTSCERPAPSAPTAQLSQLPPLSSFSSNPAPSPLCEYSSNLTTPVRPAPSAQSALNSPPGFGQLAQPPVRPVRLILQGK
ncbi:hypothetical protein PTTG_08338, partial [Puccinia triticina 1-1 BBBD Race 1]|uniref:Uncharacterized protein n=1 Tax=Puccinia triticina (isolate 1-1 / race 1 (BBBD)) TaxID=630390 RepID=A0A0C4F5D9_PUCT1